MNPLEVLDILNLIGVAHAILLSAALVSLKRGNRDAQLLLAALMAVLALLMAAAVLTHTRAVLIYPHLGQMHVPFRFLAAPLFFFYIRTVLTGNSHINWRSLVHLVPFVLCSLYLAPFYLSSGETKVLFLSNALDSFPVDWYARTIVGFAFDSVYLAAAFVVFRRNSTRSGQPGVYDGDRLLVLFLMTAMGGIWFVSLIRFIFAYRVETNLIVPLAISLTTYLICFLALVRPSVLGKDPSASKQRRYEGSTLTPELAASHLERLSKYMQDQKPYRDGNLTLPKLARRLSISAPHLSQVINEQAGQSFVDFVNSYRIEEAKRSLRDPAMAHRSIITIAEDSGFNSKSAFNTAFKKFSKKTPSEFRRLHLAEQG